MDDAQLLRYSRHIMLPQVGVEGQQRLQQSKALIIGMGGLGSPVAMYLAASGVGTLYLNDFDAVELSNLQRQIIHDSTSIGLLKTTSAARTLTRLNPEIDIQVIDEQLTGTRLDDCVGAVDVVIDGTDRFASRYAINASCIRQRTPLVSGAAIRMEGQVSVFQSALADSPCYRCLYKDAADTEQTCSENGILAPVVGMIGTIQATEALKVLLSIGTTLTGRLLILDALTMEIRILGLSKDPNCPACASTPAK